MMLAVVHHHHHHHNSPKRHQNLYMAVCVWSTRIFGTMIEFSISKLNNTQFKQMMMISYLRHYFHVLNSSSKKSNSSTLNVNILSVVFSKSSYVVQIENVKCCCDGMEWTGLNWQSSSPTITFLHLWAGDCTMVLYFLNTNYFPFSVFSSGNANLLTLYSNLVWNYSNFLTSWKAEVFFF